MFFNITGFSTYLIVPDNTTYNVTEFHVWNQGSTILIGTNASINVVAEVNLQNVYLVINETGSLGGHVIEEEGEPETEGEFERMYKDEGGEKEGKRNHVEMGLYSSWSTRLFYILRENIKNK